MAEIDQEKTLIKLDQLESYLAELKRVVPGSYAEYQTIEKRRSTERLLQLSIEAVLDTCNLIVSELDLGLPSGEADLFDKLAQKGIITEEMKRKLYEMRGFRNILVHEYASVDDRLVYETAKEKLGDFRNFADQIKGALQS